MVEYVCGDVMIVTNEIEFFFILCSSPAAIIWYPPYSDSSIVTCYMTHRTHVQQQQFVAHWQLVK